MANIVRRNERESPESREMTPRRGYFEPFARFDPFRLMAEMFRWDPFSEIDRFGSRQGSAGFMPAVDIRETPDAFVIRADLPGVKDENVDISLTGNRLTISGQREEETREESDRYHSYECSFGTFSRSLTLPDGTEPDNVRAEMNAGVLTVTVPKRPEVKARRIALGGKQPGAGGKTGQQ
jgi:HSP20 family protein